MSHIKRFHIFKRIILAVAFMLLFTGTFLLVSGGNTGRVYAEVASGTCGTCNWTISDEGVMTMSPQNGVSGQLAYTTYSPPWYQHRDSIKKVQFTGKVYAPEGKDEIFRYCSNMEEFDGTNYDFSTTKTAEMMFQYCDKMKKVTLDTSTMGNLETVYGMFYYCHSLESVDLSGMDASNLTTATWLFCGCTSLKDYKLFKPGTSTKLKKINYMFEGCESIESIDLSALDTHNVIDMTGLFEDCLKLKNITFGDNFDTRNVSRAASMFMRCESLETVDVSKFDFSNLDYWTGIRFMFPGCKSLKELDLSNWNVTKVYSFEQMFEDCVSLEKLDFSGISTRDGYNDVAYLFKNCPNLKEVKFNGNFNLQGDKDTSSDNYAYLPTPKADAAYNGKWRCLEDNQKYTAEEITALGLNLPAGTYVWDKREYKALFDSDGGSEVASQMLAYHDEVQKPDDPTKEGHTFVGWYYNGEKYDFTSKVTKNITLKARWTKPGSYTLHYPDGSTKSTDDYSLAKELLNEWELLVQHAETDENGDIILPDWATEGEILIVEKRVPAGYRAVSLETVADLADSEVTIVNSAYEEPNIQKPNPPKQASAGNVGTGDRAGRISAVIILLLAAAAVFAVSKRRFKRFISVILLLLGLSMAFSPLLTARAAAKGDVADFTIHKRTQYYEPIEKVEFAVYGKPILDDKTKVSVSKVWDDEDNELGKRPESITVDLMADGETVRTQKITADDNWAYTFEDLELHKDGNPIDYTIKEHEVEGYTSLIKESSGNEFVITNTNKKQPLVVGKKVLFYLHKEGPEFSREFEHYFNYPTLAIYDQAGNKIDEWQVSADGLNSEGATGNVSEHETTLWPGNYTIKETVSCKPDVFTAYINGPYSTVAGYTFYLETDFTLNADGSVVSTDTRYFHKQYLRNNEENDDWNPFQHAIPYGTNTDLSVDTAVDSEGIFSLIITNKYYATNAPYYK